MGEYDTAQICRNGHIINQYAATDPLHNSKFCTKCGAETIMNCQHCPARILGHFNEADVFDFTSTVVPVPAFCRNCGKAFPWTASALEAARFLADETDSLSPAERELLKSTFDDIVRDSPQTTLATTRFNKLMVKAGKGAAHAFRDILVDIASETAKKAIWG